MAAYVTVADMRAEDVPTSISDAAINAAVADVSRRAEAAARTWWDARTKTIYVNGSGRDRLALDYPLISLTSVAIDGQAVTDVSTRPDPVTGLTFVLVRGNGTFPKAEENIAITGSWGSADMSAATPAVPADIKWALKRWTYLMLAKVTDDDQAQERRMLTATNVNVSGRSLSRGPMLAPLSGDPEVDRVITSYRRPRVAVI